jgi:hypothetical protein
MPLTIKHQQRAKHSSETFSAPHCRAALCVRAGTGHVGVGQFVDQRHTRVPAQHGVQVHLLEPGAVVFAGPRGDNLQARGVNPGQRPVVVLDDRDDDVGTQRATT